ncbi:nitroreductase/quinone reductase family protein [Streptomyces sp. NPDC090741]|uniref:nitroreductase/quinone reductase family protein n=1 Tax=Streptomyces sp. NPDC090741 TaxID=3365967 RepID=UPI0038088748
MMKSAFVALRAVGRRHRTAPASSEAKGRRLPRPTTAVGNAAFRVLNRIGWTRWAGVLMRAVMVPLDTVVQARTNGRLSAGRSLGVPSLLLTTTGARSGRPRPTPLFYVDHAGGYAVAGSNFGLAHHPAWTANLLHNPAAVLSTAGQRMPVTARLVTGPEREDIWQKILTLSTGYQTYNDRSGRDLRIFHLQPTGAHGPGQRVVPARPRT